VRLPRPAYNCGEYPSTTIDFSPVKDGRIAMGTKQPPLAERLYVVIVMVEQLISVLADLTLDACLRAS
jgi:hypothetical protein